MACPRMPYSDGWQGSKLDSSHSLADPYACALCLRYSAACFEGHTSIVKLLLTAEGTDLNAQDSYGHTALMLASLRGHVAVQWLKPSTRKSMLSWPCDRALV
jgi:hypothetical protein